MARINGIDVQPDKIEFPNRPDQGITIDQRRILYGQGQDDATNPRIVIDDGNINFLTGTNGQVTINGNIISGGVLDNNPYILNSVYDGRTVVMTQIDGESPINIYYQSYAPRRLGLYPNSADYQRGTGLPAIRSDGNPLQENDEFYNTQTGIPYIYSAESGQWLQATKTLSENDLWIDANTNKISFWRGGDLNTWQLTGNDIIVSNTTPTQRSGGGNAPLVDGDIWFDTSTAHMLLYQAGAFRQYSGARHTVSTTQPELRREGDFWMELPSNDRDDMHSEIFRYYRLDLNEWVDITDAGDF